MYKKIMFLIITLSIIINVGNSTVVMAKENIVTEIVDFPVTIITKNIMLMTIMLTI